MRWARQMAARSPLVRDEALDGAPSSRRRAIKVTYSTKNKKGPESNRVEATER